MKIFWGTIYLLALASYPTFAVGQSQAGGLPALAQRVQSLEDSVGALQSALAAETTARQAADAALQTLISSLQTSINSALNAEASARQTADANLQNAINGEATARQAADASLQSAVSSLTNQVTTLQTQVANTATDVYVGKGGVSGNLNNNTPTVVASLNLPPGNYFVTSIVPLFNADGSDQDGQCHLSAAPPVPSGYFQNFGTGFQRLESGGTDHFDNGQFALIATASLPSGGNVSVACTGFNWLVNDAAIMAIKVRDVH